MYCATWTGHFNAISRSLTELYSKGIGSDALIMCKGGTLPVHKFVLVTASTTIANMFQKLPPHASPVMVLDISMEVARALVFFLYHGNVRLDDMMIQEFQRGLQILGISAQQSGAPIPVNFVRESSSTNAGYRPLLTNLDVMNTNVNNQQFPATVTPIRFVPETPKAIFSPFHNNFFNVNLTKQSVNPATAAPSNQLQPDFGSQHRFNPSTALVRPNPESAPPQRYQYTYSREIEPNRNPTNIPMSTDQAIFLGKEPNGVNTLPTFVEGERLQRKPYVPYFHQSGGEVTEVQRPNSVIRPSGNPSMLGHQGFKKRMISEGQEALAELNIKTHPTTIDEDTDNKSVT